MQFLIRALSAALGFYVATRLVHGIYVDGLGSLLLAGLLLGLLNALVRPFLVLITLPLSILTLGLFLFVLNGLIVWSVTIFLHGVHIVGLFPAILTAVTISLVSWLANGILGALDGGPRRQDLPWRPR